MCIIFLSTPNVMTFRNQYKKYKKAKNFSPQIQLVTIGNRNKYKHTQINLYNLSYPMLVGTQYKYK